MILFSRIDHRASRFANCECQLCNPTMKPQTARFWHWHHGAVLIKLQIGQSVCHSHGGRTDEGWHRETNMFSFDGETVTNEWSSDGVDCDGRLSRAGVSFCQVDCLRSGYQDETGLRFPEWQQGKSSQRDYSAEAMGY